MIEKALIDQIRSSVDIVSVIGNYISLEARGKNNFGICPFHDDTSPSMSVSSEKQIYTCFSCGATGNVFNFIMDYDHLNFVEAVKEVAVIGGIPLDIKVNGDNKTSRYNTLFEIYDLSQKFYKNNINTNEGINAINYLKSRKLDTEVINHFGIGLSLSNPDMLLKILVSRNFDEGDILETGLIGNSENGMYDLYRNRIMFPIKDVSGNLVGYSGRDYLGNSESKYINTRATKIFKKSEILYNYTDAKDHARLDKCVIIVEGFLDVIRLYTIGVKNVVALMGTSLTKEQINSIKRLSKNIYLFLDGDKAGREATISAIDHFTDNGVDPLVINIPDGLDPDDYIVSNGEEAFKRLFNAAVSGALFKMNYYKGLTNINDEVSVTRYIKSVIADINKSEDLIMRELVVNKLHEETGVSIELLNSYLKEPAEIKRIVPRVFISSDNKYLKAEKYLLYYMLQASDVTRTYEDNVVYIPTDRYRMLANAISSYNRMYEYNTADFISSISNDSSLLMVVGEIEKLNLKSDYSKEEILDYISAIKEFNINFEIDRLKKEMSLKSDPLEKAEYAKEITDLLKGV